MTRTIAVIVAASLAGQAMAAEFGLGISAKSDSGLIYVPIDVSSRFRIEPSLRHRTSESNLKYNFNGSPTTVRSEFDQIEGGIGLFGLAVPQESVRLYYGGRVSYFDGEGKSTSNSQYRQSFHGHRITPTVGFEYVFNSHFTLGGEIGYYFETSSSDTTLLGDQTEIETDTSGTESFIILRYFF